MGTLKVLNLYAGVGGNRKLWEGVEVTAVEMDPKIAAVYQRLNPEDSVIVGDAHQYLLDHYNKFDFIWSSPPCQTHSQMNLWTRHNLKRYPDMRLYEEIVFLRHFFSGVWVVENVRPYYGELIPAKKIGRWRFWSNREIEAEEPKVFDDFTQKGSVADKKAMQIWLGIHFDENLYYQGNHDPMQVLRNCVHPELGKSIFEQVIA